MSRITVSARGGIARYLRAEPRAGPPAGAERGAERALRALLFNSQT